MRSKGLSNVLRTVRQTDRWRGTQKYHQRKSRADGSALKAHCNSAHGGKLDDKCNACSELHAAASAFETTWTEANRITESHL